MVLALFQSAHKALYPIFQANRGRDLKELLPSASHLRTENSWRQSRSDYGYVIWIHCTIYIYYKCPCGIDVEYFPFDEHKCDFIFGGSWTYKGMS